MLNNISVSSRVQNNKISYEYLIDGPWREVFNVDGIEGWFASAGNGIHEFFIDYDMNIEAVPSSIAIIPFISNVLPISWLYDAQIHVEELDEDFL